MYFISSLWYIMKRLLLLVFIVLFFSQKICWWYNHYPHYENYSSELQDTLKYSGKFLDIDGLKEKDEKWWSIYYNIPPKDFLWAIIEYRLFPFVERGYAFSSNKTVFLQLISKAFGFCSQWSFSSLKNVCDHYFYDLIGPRIQISPISFSDLQQAFTIWIGLRERGHELDFDEHYVPLTHKNTAIIQEYALGDYLFGIAIAPDSSSQNFIYVLKAGGTHWQPFVSITENISVSDLIKARLSLVKQKLNLFLPVPQRDENTFYLGDFTPQYELQKNGIWKLKACFEEENVCPKYEDCKLKQKKLPLKQCENLWITLIITLWK